MNPPITHLHLHSQYSLLDGAIRLKDLPKALQERGYSGCALTDHGNLFGAVDFWKEMKKAKLKPIIGMEAYVAIGSRHLRKHDRPGPNAEHLVLLCMNREGYQNLTKLSSLAYIEGKHYGFPRMDRELLEQYNGGLIALSACLGGVLNKSLLAGDEKGAREAARWYGQVFEGRFYVELQNHAIPEEQRVNPLLMKIAEEEKLPLVGTNDCHYLNPEEAYPHYLLQLIGRQRKVTDPGTEPFSDKHLHLKNVDEMRAAFQEFPPEVLQNTAKIAEQCDVDLSCNTFYLPNYEIPQGKTLEDWLRQEAATGLDRRLEMLMSHYRIPEPEQGDFRARYQARLVYELDTICAMKYAGYFLIVADFINWAKNNGVRVGPGRGSGAGSLVAYSLRITDLDPLFHGLLFERFLNPERISMPDFDIDFDVEGRERVIEYVRKKYGENKVCQISTFGSLGAKAALRNVARVLSFPYSEADKIAKLIPNKLGITLQDSIEMEPELARLEKEGNENERKLIQCGKALEGLNSNLSTHAAGVIIMDTDIMDVMPVCTSTKGEEGIQSQFHMKSAEQQGAVKFDFLGLLNLTIIMRAVALINAHRPPDDPAFDIDAVPLDDKATYKLLSRADTMGVFQVESGGMRRLLMELKPEVFGELVAILALYRPGPLDSGMTEDFVRRKNGKAPIDSMHPLLEPVLRETYGVMAYQEQVMEAARVLAGYSLGEADLLRRAIGKKDKDELAKQRQQFVSRCVERGLEEDNAEDIFTKIDYFSGYGFNKSHSAAYGLIAYQTAYLKAHYPVEFMAALLSSDMDNTDKVAGFIADCRQMGIQVLPPDIQHSSTDFTIHGRAVRFGLNAVKNVGQGAADAILEARKTQPEGRFPSLVAFFESVDLHRVNKRVLEALIQCGGFDTLHHNRRQLLESLETVMPLAQEYANGRVEGQANLFDLMGDEGKTAMGLQIPLAQAPEFHPRDRLRLEKQSLGFYVSGHPLDGFSSELTGLSTSTANLTLEEVKGGEEVTLAGVVASLTVRMSKNDEKMAILRVEDLRGSIEVVVFPRTYAEVSELLKEDEPLLIQGKVNVREEEVNLHAERVMSLGQYRTECAQGLMIALGAEVAAPELTRLMGVLSKAPGNCQVRLKVQTGHGDEVVLDSGIGIRPDSALMMELEEVLRAGSLQFEYPKDSRPLNTRESSQGGRKGPYRGGSGGGRSDRHGLGRAPAPGLGGRPAMGSPGTPPLPGR